jgi:hypothetical protein
MFFNTFDLVLLLFFDKMFEISHVPCLACQLCKVIVFLHFVMCHTSE